MSEHFLVSALGADKTGLVEELSEAVLENGFSIADSRMAILGDHFSVLMLVTGDKKGEEGLKKRLSTLKSLEITVRQVKPRQALSGVFVYSIRIMGGDTRGIVHSITNYLKSRSVNVAAMETWVTHAPHSGTEVFNMHLTVEVPQHNNIREFKQGLLEICDGLNLDVDMEPVPA
jgi:glycine cleavage system transcriptional repressor